MEPSDIEINLANKMQSTFQDISYAERLMPSFEPALIYVVATFLTSAISIGIVLGIVENVTDYKVNRADCSCTCFDRRFKGLHFDPAAQYRHIYFNMTSQSAVILLWTILHLALLLAFVKRVFVCILEKLRRRQFIGFGPLRWHLLACAVFNFYGLVYGWWVMFNYINDAWYWRLMGVLWPTQLFFSVTDLIPAYAIYLLLPSRSSPPNRLLRLALVVSSTHVFLALWDQGAAHILARDALISRDVMFLISDIAGVIAVGPYTSIRTGQNSQRIGAGVIGLSAFYLALKVYVGSY